MSTIAEAKAALRKEIRTHLDAISPQQRRASDELLFSRFLDLPRVRQARTVFAFWGVPPREPDTGRLTEQLTAAGKRVALPCTLPQRQMQLRLFTRREALISAAYGIMQPDFDSPVLLPEEIDLVLVPALCCDRRGFRLGQGGGYYDRWLAAHPCPTVCLCRDSVLQDRLPTEPHDCPVDLVLTETLLLFRNGQGTEISLRPRTV